MLTKENWKWHYSENVWERHVGARIRNLPISGVMVQEHAKAEAKTWGEVNLGHLMDGKEVLRKRHQIMYNEIFGKI